MYSFLMNHLCPTITNEATNDIIPSLRSILKCAFLLLVACWHRVALCCLAFVVQGKTSSRIPRYNRINQVQPTNTDSAAEATSKP